MIKKRLLILFIGLISLSLLEFQYLNLVIHTPKNSIYLGTVHFPPDYFSYLSFMVQGKDHLLSSTILYTSEKTPLVMVRWQFVLIGKLLSLLPLNTGQMYQIAVVVFTVGFIVGGYFLISLLLDKYEEKILAFIFFVSSTAWPIINTNDGKLNLAYHHFWYNTGDLFARFGPTPNHLLGSIILTFGFILILHWCKKVDSKYKISYLLYNCAFTFIGLSLASLSPMHWILLLGSMIGLLVITSLRALINKKKNFFDILIYLQPILFSMIGGLSSTLYMLSVYKIFPYNIGNSWEVIQQVFMNFPNLFYGSGIVVIFALVGCYSYFRHKLFSPERLATLFFISMSLTFFFTDLPWRLGTSNVRFWPEGIYIFIAVIAAHGVLFLARLAKRAKYIVLIILLILYLATTIPTLVAEINERSGIDKSNFYFLPQNIFEVYGYASKTIKRPSVFLIPWPFDNSFPAFTGHKSFTGHPLSQMNIDSEKKYALSTQFYSGTLDEKKAREILVENGIQYVLTPTQSVVEKYSFLNSLYRREGAAIFEVR